MSTSLDRLVALVGRTGLPTMISSEEGGEPCVVLPLSVYERLAGGGLADQNSVSQAPSQAKTNQDHQPAYVPEAESVTTPAFSLQAFSLPPTPNTQPVEEAKSEDLRLQDLFQAPDLAISSNSPQSAVPSDKFVFDGNEIRIMPQITQKTANIGFGLDGFEQTLA